MTRLRLCLASLLLASSLSTACSTVHAAHGPTAPAQIQPVRTVDRAVVRAKLAARRAETVQNFLAYRDARTYPMTSMPLGGFHHVWIDGEGNLCAAATLISKDWGREATIRAGGTGALKLSTVTAGPLADWILTSGLTHQEIVAIQVPGWKDMSSGRPAEIQRLFAIYVDVERQLHDLADKNLDAAVDALMKRPELARGLVDGKVAGPGTFATPTVG
jgi:hypothetical protein